MNFRLFAKDLLNKGFAVFPLHGIHPIRKTCTCGRSCDKPAKHPCFTGWQKAALGATDDDINTWHQAWPNCNVGIATDNMIVIDVDDMSCDLAQELLPLLPATKSALTGREGGLHRYYRAERPHKLTVHTFGGIDVRAKGGYVVAPPSRHISGRTYTWIPGYGDTQLNDLAILPDAVIALLESKIATKKVLVTATVGGPENLVKHGQRHEWLRDQIFRRVVTTKMSEGEIRAVVEKYLLDKVEDGQDISDQEINSLIRGAYVKRKEFYLTDMSESGVATMFVEFWAGKLVKLESGLWYQFNGSLWNRIDQPEALFSPVRKLLYEVNREGADDTRLDKLNKWWGQSGSWRFAEAVVKFASPPLSVSVDQFTVPLDTLPFENGLYNLVTGDFRPFSSDDHIMNTVKAQYNPNVTAPKWTRIIKYITGGDPEIVRYMQQRFGYFLSTRTMRGVFFLVGPKNTGKTTLISALAEILGPTYAGTAQLGLIHTTRSFSEDEDQARTALALVGKRFVYMDETRKNEQIDPAKFKRIASRDTVLTARRLRNDAFQFVNRAKVIVLTNQQPQIDPDDDAAWDRVQYLPFLVSISKKDRKEGFKDELVDEAAGILNWCIEGFKDYLANGMILPPSVQAQVDEWQTEDNPLAEFLNDRCTVAPDEQTTVQNLWKGYESWRILAGYGQLEGKVPSASAFGKALLRLLGDKVTTGKSNGKRWIRGVNTRAGV